MKKTMTIAISALTLIGCTDSNKQKQDTELSMKLYHDYNNVFEVNITKASSKKEKLIFSTGVGKEIILLESEEVGKYDFICMPILIEDKNVTLDCSGRYPHKGERPYVSVIKYISKDVLYNVGIGKDVDYTLIYRDSNMTIKRQ